MPESAPGSSERCRLSLMHKRFHECSAWTASQTHRLQWWPGRSRRLVGCSKVVSSSTHLLRLLLLLLDIRLSVVFHNPQDVNKRQESKSEVYRAKLRHCLCWNIFLLTPSQWVSCEVHRKLLHTESDYLSLWFSHGSMTGSQENSNSDRDFFSVLCRDAT